MENVPNFMTKYNGSIFTQTKNMIMVGRVGYAPTTPAMSMQYSTIELTAQSNFLRNFLVV